MTFPTLDDARAVKTEIVARLGHHRSFLGAGIGQRDGRWIVRVNWRELPQDVRLPERLGDVEIGHFQTAAPRPQSPE